MESQIISYLWDTFVAEGILVIAAVFILGQLIKQVPLFAKIPNRYISIIGIIVGAAIAILSPDVYPGASYLTAGLKGGCLGLMTTGLYEVLKIFFPVLSAKLEEKTSVLDSTLAEVVDAATEGAKEDLKNSAKNERPVDELVNQVVDKLEESIPEESIKEITDTIQEVLKKEIANTPKEDK